MIVVFGQMLQEKEEDYKEENKKRKMREIIPDFVLKNFSEDTDKK